MISYLLYGCNTPLVEAEEMLSNILQIQFNKGDSDYHSGEYFRAGEKSAENFEIKKNIDPFDEEPIEQEFPEYSTLLFINATKRADSLQTKLDQIKETFTLLRHEKF